MSEIYNQLRPVVAAFDTRISETNERLLSSFPVDTAQGAIASFTDGADNLPLESLVVGIEPVQDLHGYANPWPAGGGKNKLAPWVTTQEHRGVMWTANSDGTFTSSGTADNNSQIISPDFLLPAGEYIISGCPECGTGDTCFFRLLRYNGNTLIGSASDYGSGATFTITGEETRLIVFVSVNANQVAPSGIWKPMVRVSTDPDATFTPYENICPISGLTGAEVTHLGTNFWDEEWETGLISTSNGQNVNGTGIRGKNMCACLPNTTYYAHSESGGNKYVFWYDESEGFISAVNVTNTHVITSPANARFFRIMNDGLSTYNHDISVNYPSTDHDYHAYSGSVIPITFPASAGTVYGGTLDITNGVLTVDGAIITFDGSSDEQWAVEASGASNQYFRCKIGAYGSVVGDYAVSNQYKQATISGSTTAVGINVYNSAEYNSAQTAVRPSNVAGMTLATFTAAIGATPLQVCYKLATPTVYQLDPVSVSSILGANNIYCDTGDTSAEYRADPTLYINRKIAEAVSALS